ncbi:MAG: leucine-rich repeat domain-containing protein [Oscillospiraceae bacterium]|nr:leucine-rich repeat domain-containing protein [Oscillospiraceae bacterium]
MKKTFPLLLTAVTFIITACHSSIPESWNETESSTTIEAMSVDSTTTETTKTTEPTPVEWVEIDLSGQGITDEMLAQYVADGTIPQNVTHLSLWGNQITDISTLSGLTNLMWLRLWGNPVTQGRIDELQAALPNCFISY